MTTATLQLDTTKLEELISSRNFVEAKKMIDDVVDQELPPEEKGQAYVKIASIYLEITNRLNREYIAELDETLGLLKEATKSEKSTNDQLNVIEVKQQLADNS